MFAAFGSIQPQEALKYAGFETIRCSLQNRKYVKGLWDFDGNTWFNKAPGVSTSMYPLEMQIFNNETDINKHYEHRKKSGYGHRSWRL